MKLDINQTNPASGSFVANIYNVDTKTFVFKLNVPLEKTKVKVMIESGIRFHETGYHKDNSGEMPNGFVMKLRKHIKERRLDSIEQVNNDRVVVLSFGVNKQGGAMRVILEMHSKGNVVLTDHDYNILSVLRVFVGQDQKVLVKHKYEFHVQATKELALLQQLEHVPNPKNKVLSVRQRLAHRSCELSRFGSEVLTHCVLLLGLPQDCVLEDLGPTPQAREAKVHELHALVLETAPRVLASLNKSYVITDQQGMFESFECFDFLQHQESKRIEFDSMSLAVDEYYSQMDQQRNARGIQQAEKKAEAKVSKSEKQHQAQMAKLERNVGQREAEARAVEENLHLVDGAIQVVNSLLAQGMDWDDLDEVVAQERANGNQVASVIKALKLEANSLTLIFDKILVKVRLDMNAHANLAHMYAQRKEAQRKLAVSTDHSTRLLSKVKAQTQHALEQTLHQRKQTAAKLTRKVYWFEKFNWFLTSEGCLVLSGRDAQQNELLVKRYMRKHDLYIHADIHGASTCILRNPVKTGAFPLESLRQAGMYCICRSSAWKAKILSGAYWVEAHQVSKTAQNWGVLVNGVFHDPRQEELLGPFETRDGVWVYL